MDLAVRSGSTRRWRRLRAFVLQRDGGRCVRCGSRVRLECHHVVPLASGGRDEPANCRTHCVDCHNGLHGPLRMPRSDDRRPAHAEVWPRGREAVARRRDAVRVQVRRDHFTAALRRASGMVPPPQNGSHSTSPGAATRRTSSAMPPSCWAPFMVRVVLLSPDRRGD